MFVLKDFELRSKSLENRKGHEPHTAAEDENSMREKGKVQTPSRSQQNWVHVRAGVQTGPHRGDSLGLTVLSKEKTEVHSITRAPAEPQLHRRADSTFGKSCPLLELGFQGFGSVVSFLLSSDVSEPASTSRAGARVIFTPRMHNYGLLTGSALSQNKNATFLKAEVWKQWV